MKSMRTSVAAAAVILAGIMLAATPCWAQAPSSAPPNDAPAEPPDQTTDGDASAATHHHQRGIALADAGKHAEAAAAFARAYALDPQVKYLFNQALALGKADRCDKSVPLFDQVLTHSLPPEIRTTAEAERARCVATRPEPATAPTPASTTPTPLPPAPVPLPNTPVPLPNTPVAPTPAAPGPRITAPSHTPLPPGQRDDAHTPWYGDAGGWVLAGSGLVALGLGTGLMIDQQRLRLAAAALEQPPENTYKKHAAVVGRADSERLVGALALVGGAALAAGAIIRFAIVDGAGGEDSGGRAQLDLVIAPNGNAGLGFGWRF